MSLASLFLCFAVLTTPRGYKFGAPSRIRTCNRPLRRRVLYPVELCVPDAGLSRITRKFQVFAPALEGGSGKKRFAGSFFLLTYPVELWVPDAGLSRIACKFQVFAPALEGGSGKKRFTGSFFRLTYPVALWVLGAGLAAKPCPDKALRFGSKKSACARPKNTDNCKRAHYERRKSWEWSDRWQPRKSR